MAEFIWQLSRWPRFRWSAERLLPAVADARFAHGRLIGRMAASGLETRQEAEFTAATEEAAATSAIEGEELRPASVRSCIARRLGLPKREHAPEDSRIDGVAEMVLDATRNCLEPLTEGRLFGWHRSLFAASRPLGRSLQASSEVGRWRTDVHGPMQLVSGTSREGEPPRVRPPPARVPSEMAGFLDWFTADTEDLDALVRAGIAHLWFAIIHPFCDGNGPIGRAIADMAIAQAEPTGGQRFYSLSSAILRQRRTYYAALERTQRGDLDVTEWLIWFLECHGAAVMAAERAAQRVIEVARF